MDEHEEPRTFTPPPPPPPPYSTPPPPPPPPPPYTAPPQPVVVDRGRGWAPFLGGMLIGCGCLPILAIWILMVIFASSFPRGGAGPKGDSLGLINVTGVITSGEPDGGSPFGGAGADAQDIIGQLEKARKNSAIKAIVLWIDSPGGSAAGSDAVYNEILKVRTGGGGFPAKKVVVAMGDVAASGGYYIASAADRIFADGATLTGSIGVISELPNFSNPNGWIAKSGYSQVVIKSGKYKDMGNPFRPMTADEKALFQTMVNDIYTQFLTAVSSARKIPVAQLRPIADGRVFTGRQAIKNHLIDEIGTLRDAEAYAWGQAGLRGEPKVYSLGTTGLARLFDGTDTMGQELFRKRALRLMLLDPRAAALGKAMEGTD